MWKKFFLVCLTSGLIFSNTINQIIISGNFSQDTSMILDVIKSKSGENLLTENVIEDIRRVYETGFFKDDITAEPIFYDDGTLDLVFNVSENPPITSIQFKGLHTFTAEQLFSSMDSKSGELLSYRKLRKDIRAITNYYHEKGYVLMRIKQVIEPTDVAGDLIFVINEGIVEDIFIKGLTYTKEFVILREMETQKDKAFNLNTLQEDVRSIFNTGFVDNINIEPSLVGVDPEKVVAVINVLEKKSGSFQFGGGVGSSSGFFGFLQLSFINFLGEGYNLAAKGQVGEKQTNYELQYHNPWFFPDVFGDRVWTTFRLWHTDGQIDEGQGLNAYNSGGEVALGKQLNRAVSVFGSVRINNVSSYTEIPVPNTSPTENIRSYAVRSIGGGMSYDTRDNRFSPSSGEYLYFRSEASLKALGASVEYLKNRVQMYKYFPLPSGFAFCLKSQADAAVGTIFDTERYFAGGSTTIRGYQDGTPFGVGGSRVMLTTELKYVVNQLINVYGFFDIGRIGQGLQGCDVNMALTPDTPEWRYGYGVGFQILTPIAQLPLRFDFAWGDGQNYGGFESYSLKQSGQMTVHFNMGSSF